MKIKLLSEYFVSHISKQIAGKIFKRYMSHFFYNTGCTEKQTNKCDFWGVKPGLSI